MATFITADLHLFHEGILRFCPETRPFKNAAEMNDAIVESWRKAVRRADTVIVVGDFAHRAAADVALRKLFLALPGDKILCRGNHDGPSTLALPWKSQHEILNASIDGSRVVFCHYALRSWEGIRKGALQLYGHHHGRLPGNTQSMDVGVDVFGFAPQRLNVIKARLATLPPLVDPEGRSFGNDLDGGPSL